MKRFRIWTALLAAALLLPSLSASAAVPAGGKTVTMETASQALNNRTYVPVRYVLEGLGLTVGYEANGQYVAVSTGTLGNISSLTSTQQLSKALGGGAASTKGTLVSAALDRGAYQTSYDTSSPSSAFFPELGAAIGHNLYWKSSSQSSSGGIFRSYAWAKELSREEVLEELGAYVDLLASLPNFEIVEPFSNIKGDYYEGPLRYTGTGRMEGDLESRIGGTACHVCVLYNSGWNNVDFYYDFNLKPVDTGHRISGAGSLSTQKGTGTRFADAYYKNGDTYYNSSDGKLSAKAGECAILVNGTDRCTGTVTFQFNKSFTTDELSITGYYRDDEVGISFPQNQPMAGDVYTIEDFQRQSGLGRWRYIDEDRTGIMATHNGARAYPTASPYTTADAATARVLKWDKSGDTVVYFYLEGATDGEPYQIEGLAVANWKEAAPSSSSGSGGDKDCLTCRGSGRCTRCGGSGRVTNWMPGTRKYVEQTCTGCGGDGRR